MARLLKVFAEERAARLRGSIAVTARIGLVTAGACSCDDHSRLR